jgi:hypothetical protein
MKKPIQNKKPKTATPKSKAQPAAASPAVWGCDLSVHPLATCRIGFRIVQDKPRGKVGDKLRLYKPGNGPAKGRPYTEVVCAHVFHLVFDPEAEVLMASGEHLSRANFNKLALDIGADDAARFSDWFRLKFGSKPVLLEFMMW